MLNHLLFNKGIILVNLSDIENDLSRVILTSLLQDIHAIVNHSRQLVIVDILLFEQLQIVLMDSIQYSLLSYSLLLTRWPLFNGALVLVPIRHKILTDVLLQNLIIAVICHTVFNRFKNVILFDLLSRQMVLLLTINLFILILLFRTHDISLRVATYHMLL